jgi:hypothetical protein
MYLKDMMESGKTTNVTFYVEGPDWTEEIIVDVDIFDDEASQLFEAGTKAIEKQVNEKDELNVGALLLIKKGKKTSKEAMVNAYICLNNAAQYDLAEKLKKNFLEASGQDLSLDEPGYTYS